MITLTKENRLEPWNIWQLETMHNEDIKQCQTAFERANAIASHRMDLRKYRDVWKAKRKLSPGEVAILESHGINA